MTDTIAIPFDRATYCADCNLIVDTSEHRCPVCRSIALYNLARMLERKHKCVAHLNHSPQTIGDKQQ